jgi:mRNA-degrading endonuclease RelE of RelBE toxin-antitoxin system
MGPQVARTILAPRALTGNDGVLRLRIGDFRVTFTETNDTVNVLDVGPRGGVHN